MSHFLTETITDMRCGRQTWRVVLTLCAPSFAAAVVFGLFRF